MTLTIAMNSLNHRSVERELYIIRDMHLIKYVGSNKTGHWEVVTEKYYFHNPQTITIFPELLYLCSNKQKNNT